MGKKLPARATNMKISKIRRACFKPPFDDARPILKSPGLVF